MSDQSNIIYTCWKCKIKFTKINKYDLCSSCNKCTCNLCSETYTLTKYSPKSVSKHVKVNCKFADLAIKMTKCWKCLVYNGKKSECYTCCKHIIYFDFIRYGNCCSATCALIYDSDTSVKSLPWYNKSLIHTNYALKLDYKPQDKSWKDKTLYYNIPKYQFPTVTLDEDMIKRIDHNVYERNDEDMDDNYIYFNITSAIIVKRD